MTIISAESIGTALFSPTRSKTIAAQSVQTTLAPNEAIGTVIGLLSYAQVQRGDKRRGPGTNHCAMQRPCMQRDAAFKMHSH